MKHSLFALIILSILISCSNSQEKQKTNELQSQVETHLSQAIVIDGETEKFFTIEERMKYHKVPGLSIAIIYNGKIQWAKGYGYTSFDSTKLVDTNTLFQAASISKPVAAMGSLYLVQEGKISLDTDVNEYLLDWKIIENEFTETEKVTLSRLLSHSAGLTVHGFRGYAEGEAVPEITQILNGEKPANSDAIIPDTIPGAINRYSGGGYTVMQKMLIDITGTAFPDFMQQAVISKIGMTNSTYMQPLPIEFQQKASTGHRADGESIEGNWHTYPEMAAAGLWTSPTDLAKFAIEVQQSVKGLSNKVISKELTEKMVSKYIKNQGLGFGIGGEGDSIRFGHGGANEGFRCQLVAFTNLGMGAVIMANSDNGGNLASEVLRSISRTYSWNVFLPKVKKVLNLDSEKLKQFIGKYQMNPEYVVEISMKDDNLFLKQLWDNGEYNVFPEAENKFFEKDGAASFVFELNSEGVYESFTVFGEYKFVRVIDNTKTGN